MPLDRLYECCLDVALPYRPNIPTVFKKSSIPHLSLIGVSQSPLASWHIALSSTKTHIMHFLSWQLVSFANASASYGIPLKIIQGY